MKTKVMLLVKALSACLLLFPCLNLLLQKRYKQLALHFFLVFFAFSVPAWIRAWEYPEGFLFSLCMVLLAWVVFFCKTQKNTYPHSVSWRSYFINIVIYVLFVASFFIFCLTQSKWLWGYQLFHIPTPSMAPTLWPGDFVVTDTWGSDFKRSHIVVFKHQESINKYFMVKRVTHIPDDIFHGRELQQDQLVVIGDNRDESHDSRVFGPVNKGDVIGRVVWVAASYDGQWKIDRFLLNLNQ